MCRATYDNDFLAQNSYWKEVPVVSDPDEWLIRMEFSPKTYDIDAFGIVSNLTYVRWLEDMRTEFLHRYLPWDRLEEEDLAPVLAETNIQYKSAVKMDQDIEGKLTMTDVGRTSWHLEFVFDRDGEVVLTAQQSGMFVDTESQSPRRLPEDLREKLLETIE